MLSSQRSFSFLYQRANKLCEAYTANNIGRRGTVGPEALESLRNAISSDEVCNVIEVYMDQPLLVRL